MSIKLMGYIKSTGPVVGGVPMLSPAARFLCLRVRWPYVAYVLYVPPRTRAHAPVAKPQPLDFPALSKRSPTSGGDAL